jgi:hypothetical protein
MRRQAPIDMAIEESVDRTHEIYDRVFRKVPEHLIRAANRSLGGDQCPNLFSDRMEKTAQIRFDVPMKNA